MRLLAIHLYILYMNSGKSPMYLSQEGKDNLLWLSAVDY